MISIKTKEEIAILREGGKRLAAIRDALARFARAGLSSQDVEDKAEELFAEFGGEPSFFNYKSKKSEKPFPAFTCISVNDAIVHGLPSRAIVFREGDVVGIDVGLKYKGLFTDTAVTIPIGVISNEAQTLLEVTRNALAVGIGAVRAGVTTGDLGFAIEQYVQSRGTPPHQLSRHCSCKFSEDSPDFSVHAPSCPHSQNESSNSVQRKSWCRGKYGIVRTLSGHGVGYAVHEEPHIPNFGKKGEGAVLKKGMVIAIEPMLTLGGEKLVLDPDGFTFRTADSSLSAHFEHTVAVTEKGADMLTSV